jgi:hypothetical protein
MGGVVYQPPLDISGASRLICDAIKNSTGGWAAGKLGTSELNALIFYLHRQAHKNQTQNATPPPSYPSQIVKDITVNAGLWAPPTLSIDAAIDIWALLTLKALDLFDVVAEWNPTNQMQEGHILYRYANKAARVVLRAFEPFYSPQNQYTLNMTQGPIAVVSPFAKSIESQWPKRAEIFPPTGQAGQMWTQDQILVPIVAPYGPHMTTIASQMWPKTVLEEGPEAAVTYLAQKVTDSGARYAFVGIGALSIPLVAELKRRNIVAIHTGGGTQIMFGLKGRRWLNHSIISTFFNAAWTNPTPEETPSYAQRVEGACYW